MSAKKLLWIILLQKNNQDNYELDLTSLNNIASSFNFNTEFRIIANNKVLTDCEKLKLNTDAFYSINIYDSKVKLNTCIMKQLENVNVDNVIVMGSNYLKHETIIKKMIMEGSKDGVNFVHLKHHYNGFFTELTNLTSKVYNKIVKMFTGSNDRLFIRNCAMFNKVVLQLMQDFPNNSGIIRETNFLACTQNVEINIDKDFEKSKWKMNSIKLFISSLILGLISIGLFVVICAVRMNIDILLWLIIVLIITTVISVVALNYSILKDKISIDNFFDEQTQSISPIESAIFNERVFDEEVLEEEQLTNVAENTEKPKNKDVKKKSESKNKSAKTTKSTSSTKKSKSSTSKTSSNKKEAISKATTKSSGKKTTKKTTSTKNASTSSNKTTKKTSSKTKTSKK